MDAAPVGGCVGAACLFELWDGRPGTCGELVDAVDDWTGRFPVWHEGRALFVSDGVVNIAGAFNDWDAAALATAAACDGALFAVEAAIPSGHYPYKIVDGGEWKLDPMSWAFAYDDFAGNPDGVNSMLNTYDSGVGHLVQPAELVCSEELGNCRPLTAYLPPGYDAPDNAARDYPVLFMHDGQNIFDDTDCCFGHTGWEINRRLDADIAAGLVEPVVVVGFDHAGAGRTDEYGYAAVEGGLRETFMAFQVEVVQPTAMSYWRLDDSRVYAAGSSLGGHVSLALAFAYPDVYAGVASLSGSMWMGVDSGTSIADIAAAQGKLDVVLYLDHGGSAADPVDNYAGNVEVLGLLESLGWTRSDAPGCTTDLCYFHDVGAVHNELAWRDRAHHFLRFLFPVSG